MSYEDCIDVVQEWVQNQGYLATGYVDRGDPGAPDFITGNFLADSLWHILDLSAIVPAGAKAVAVSGRIRKIQVGHVFQLRRGGNVNSDSKAHAYTQLAMIRLAYDFTVAVDSNRKIEYYLTAVAWNEVFMTVKGWWL